MTRTTRPTVPAGEPGGDGGDGVLLDPQELITFTIDDDGFAQCCV